jgi:Lhr-like helicase|tara:strand:- start:299 stop:517 length:219 start_codon:yes stop_codon:yes gene_type:complete
MNKNFDLVHKSLDTITPDWQTVLVATVTESGFEYDIFNKMEEKHFQENLAVLLALVAKKSLQELERIDWLDN